MSDDGLDKSIYDGPEFAQFCETFNTRLCVLEFRQKAAQLQRGDYDPSAPTTVLLPIQHPTVVEPLLCSDYADFIGRVCAAVAITPAMHDAFFSELDDVWMAAFSEALVQQRTRISIEILKDSSPAPFPGLAIQLPDFLCDVLIAPLSQLHTDVVGNFFHFLQRRDIVEGDMSSLFLNARTASFFTQFVLLWVATRLGVPLHPFAKHSVIAVV